MLPGNLPDIFLDTDVSFDIISKLEPHFGNSIKLLELAAQNKLRLMISESSLGNLFYLTFDIYKVKDGVQKLTDFIEACHLIQASKQITKQTLYSAFKDKEDALQYFTAIANKAEYFITRNVKDYKKYQQTELTEFIPTSFLVITES